MISNDGVYKLGDFGLLIDLVDVCIFILIWVLFT